MSEGRRSTGVIGLGQMGRRVAAKLVDSGHEVHVWDRKGDAIRDLERRGAVPASTPAELATHVETAFSVLSDDKAVQEVVLDGGVLASLPSGSIFADLSTTSVALTAELEQQGRACGVDVLDVEMSGSTPHVESGELVLLVGGDEAVLERARPLLELFSRTILHVGPHGSGAKMKLVVNTLLGVGMEALAEAIAFGEAIGLERERLLDGLEQLSVVAPAHKPKLGNARVDRYPVAFALRLMDKDFGLVLREAKRAGLELPATAASARVCRETLQAVDGDEDFSVVIRGLAQTPALRQSGA